MKSGVHPLAGIIAALARAISGVQVRWACGLPETTRQRIYFANHTSHLDFVVLWSALPGEVRARTRPVAAKDYWKSSALRRYLALKVSRAVLVQRGAEAQAASEDDARAAGRALIEQLAEAMSETESLILFPEGTPGTGDCRSMVHALVLHTQCCNRCAQQIPNTRLTLRILNR